MNFQNYNFRKLQTNSAGQGRLATISIALMGENALESLHKIALPDPCGIISSCNRWTENSLISSN